MNENLRNFILELANNNMRIDGRKGECYEEDIIT